MGIGINCLHRPEDFPAQLRDMAASLSMVTGREITISATAAAMVNALAHMDKLLLREKDSILDAYRRSCMTLGQEVVVVRGAEKHYGKAVDVDTEGALVVDFTDGTRRAVSSGEVSVRGMYGYI